MLLQNLLHITLALLCFLQHICICDPSMSYARYEILFFNQIPTIKPINQYATYTLHHYLIINTLTELRIS